jgi:hypothetical protein
MTFGHEFVCNDQEAFSYATGITPRLDSANLVTLPDGKVYGQVTAQSEQAVDSFMDTYLKRLSWNRILHGTLLIAKPPGITPEQRQLQRDEALEAFRVLKYDAEWKNQDHLLAKACGDAITSLVNMDDASFDDWYIVWKKGQSNGTT